jgi:hypothetical protein
MKQLAFLSIDLDYFDGTISGKTFDELMNFIFSNLKKIKIYVEHEEILEDVNSSKARTLINIDKHDDYTYTSSKNRNQLNCGNWVDFVSWKKSGEYIWVLPYYNYFFLGKQRKNQDKWGKDRFISYRPMNLIKKHEIENCSICISPNHFIRYDCYVCKNLIRIINKNKDKIICSNDVIDHAEHLNKMYKETTNINKILNR